jgi:high-affinity iron transporter
LATVIFGLLCPIASAAGEYDSWSAVVGDMELVFDEAQDLYMSGDADAAKERINVAYFSYYEKLGFEKTVMAHISGDRAAKVEYQFSSFLIIMRDGFEAILIVSAIAAYLVKSGNKGKIKAIYAGVVAALAASAATAILFNIIVGGGGANQEIVEGVTVLFAVAVLFYVSNWMLGKADAAAWSGYVEGKARSSVARGSVVSLAFAVFLAVFREGAEIILFYWALFANTKTHAGMVWTGIAAGCVALAAVYVLIRVLSVRLPLSRFSWGQA